MKLEQYKPECVQSYVNHYLKGGSVIGPYFNANQLQHGGGFAGLLASAARTLIPFLKSSVKSLAKKGVQRAVPILKNEGKKVLNQGAREIFDVLNKKQTKKQAWENTKKNLRKRALEIAEEQILPKKVRKDIFS